MNDCTSMDRRRETHGSRLLQMLLLALLWTMVPATHTQAYVVALSTQELTDRAELIVRGVVENVSATAQSIEITVRREQTIKGSAPGGTIRIRYPRGMEDTPQFVAGERVLLFLTAVADGTWQVVGGPQGKIKLDAAR